METNNGKMPNLLPVHLDDLRRSGLTDATIAEAGLYSETDHNALSNVVNGTYPKLRGPALVIPYRETTGELNGFKRVKPGNPAKDRNGRAIKYLSPRGARNRAYFPLPVIAILDNPAGELVVTEGEKKALALSQDGFPAIGLAGVWNWKDGKKTDRLIPDLDTINWQGRRVFVCFDSDLADKPEVKEAESRLAVQLTARGAVVKVVRLPNAPDGAKQGADDYLVAQGRVEFRRLLDKAVVPEPVNEKTIKTDAGSLDPMDEARRFVALNATHDGELKLRVHYKSYHYWTGSRYVEQDGDYIESRLYEFLDPVARFITRGVISNLKAALVAQIVLSGRVEMPSWLDDRGPAHDYIALQNGILNIAALLAGRPGALLPHSPLWFSAVCLPYEFDAAATCPKWLACLDRNLEGDLQRIELLQEMAGYCLTHDTSMQRFLVVHGDGGTGKSTACAVLTALLGTDNVSHLSIEEFGQRFRLYETLGKLANIVPEIGEIDKVAEGVLKAFTSGDRMGFERKYHDTVVAMPTARLILATNNLPRFTDKTSGIWRRMLLMPFRVVVPEADRVHGMDKPEWWHQQGELPGILNWAIDGLRRLRQNGRFTTSNLCNRELAAYRVDCNPAALFLAETCAAMPSADVVTADVYARYSTWCDQNGYRRLAANSFGREIQRAFPQAEQGKVWNREGRRTEGYKGIALRDEIGNGEDAANAISDF